MSRDETTARIEVDVVVVGAGNAALAAALAAREYGASVVVLEAADESERGGNSVFTGGFFRFAYDTGDQLLDLLDQSFHQYVDRVDVRPYDSSAFKADLERTSEGRCDPELTDILVSQSLDAVRWLHERGVAWQYPLGKVHDMDNLPPDTKYVLHGGAALVTIDEGVGLMDSLFLATEKAGVDVWYGAPMRDFVTDGKQVVGVRALRDGVEVDVIGAVVLAAGGFGANPELRRRYLGEGWDLVKIRGSRFSMGDVLERALRLGAAPVGHWGGCHASPLAHNAPDIGRIDLGDRMSRYSYPYSVMVNRDGRRFVDEGSEHLWLTYAKTGTAIQRQPGGIAFQIFDQQTAHLLEPRYELSTPIVADTLEELAALTGIDEAGLLRTVEEFNAAPRTGTFDPLTTDGLRVDAVTPQKSNWALPLVQPPYVAYAVECGLTFTFGGIRIDRDAQVLDVFGQPIEGLYATGEVTGGVFFHNYPAGSGLTFGTVFGKIAGESAARARRAG